jgi:YebC/PmpR family DNA-binding regulatory protein
MAGHSKFANRKHRKARQDNKRAKLFTRISREIIIAVRAGGSDPELNPRLRMALDNARVNNIPNDNINRAIDKGLGNTDGSIFEEFVYEGYGPGGVAILLEMATDNRKRAAADTRHILSKHGGSLGQDGCVAWMFNRKGIITIIDESLSLDDLILHVLEAGGEDVEEQDDLFIVYTTPNDVYTVAEALKDKGVSVNEVAIEFVPSNSVDAPEEHEDTIEKLLDALEDCEDIQNVYTNLS